VLNAADAPPSINTNEETGTPRIVIVWDKAPKNSKHFFANFDVPLEWVYDFEDDNGKPTHSVYVTDTTAQANELMTAIIKILEDEDDSYGEQRKGPQLGL
jgi:hypothetical protein